MKLRDDAHKALDELDSQSLAVIYDQMRLLLDIRSRTESTEEVPSIEKIWEMADQIPGCWSDDLIEEREDRF